MNQLIEKSFILCEEIADNRSTCAFYFIGRYGANERWDHWCTKRKEKKKVQKDLDDLKDSTNCGWNETRICPITDAYK